MNNSQYILVLLQNDLRLHDNPALYYAAATDLPIIVVYLEEKRLGAAGKYWLSQSLSKLASALEKYNLPLLYYNNDINSLITLLEKQVRIEEIYYNHLDQSLDNVKIASRKFYANLLYGNNIPADKQKQYKVCAAFWKHHRKNFPTILEPLGKPKFKMHPQSFDKLDKQLALPVMNGYPWWNKLANLWAIGEEAALKRWYHFKDQAIDRYDVDRNMPAIDGSSKLSPYLKFGEISVRKIWHDLQNHSKFEASWPVRRFINELAWREFSYHLLSYNSQLHAQPLKAQYSSFAWQYDNDLLQKWQQGQTGYPIIDAGMRQLWQTGWMHNRIRMVTASFLSKNLLIAWQDGEKWFFDCLFDADTALNATNWQWVAGCGTDSAPYFRIFSPILQGKKFDPLGKYVKEWIPELHDLSIKNIHTPWLDNSKAPDYPLPIVDLTISRQRALQAERDMKAQQKVNNDN